jgi:YidC/Oxa1 family membrane protein insertase
MSYITLPFSWLLNFFYDTFQNYGIAIILFGVLVKLIMLPFQMKSKHSMMRTTVLGPHMKELEKKYGNNKQKYQEELSKLYKREKINPASGCIWTLIPFPILIALYSVVRQPLSKLMNLTAEQITTVSNKLAELGVYVAPAKAGAYEEMTLANLIHENLDAVKAVVSAVKDIDFNFFGLNLSLTPQWNFFSQVNWSDSASWGPALGLFLIPFISAGLSYLTTQLTQKNNPTANMGGAAGAGMGKTMMLTMPLVSVYICFIMPAAMGLYWIVQSALSCLEEIILGNHYRRAMEKENADFLERERIRDEELERKREETERLRAEGKNTMNPSTSKKKLVAQQKAEEEARRAAAEKAERAERRARYGFGEEKEPDSQVGNRRFARGRAYMSERFESAENESSMENVSSEDETDKE